MPDEARRWLRQAEDDYATATLLLEQGKYSACAFYCHQTAEKALKALLYALGDRPWGHSLPGLLDRVVEATASSPNAAVETAVSRLDKHYTSARYPDAFESAIPAECYTAMMAQETLEWADTILQFVTQHLR